MEEAIICGRKVEMKFYWTPARELIDFDTVGVLVKLNLNIKIIVNFFQRTETVANVGQIAGFVTSFRWCEEMADQNKDQQQQQQQQLQQGQTMAMQDYQSVSIPSSQQVILPTVCYNQGRGSSFIFCRSGSSNFLNADPATFLMLNRTRIQLNKVCNETNHMKSWKRQKRLRKS